MKPNAHPIYRTVLFKDSSSEAGFLVRSTIHTTQTAEWKDGKTYPVINMEITSASHPYFTGQQRMLDTQGRVERFTKRYAKKGS
ncbi:MAG: type B 50S ribosomal protein L31 [Gemmatimonadales bacterium]|nr:type B 50S ribosomal protein L31 [Gemmatimonadales bacterium]